MAVANAVDKAPPKVDLSEALTLRLVNKLTYQQIADRYNVSKQAIQQRLSTFIATIDDPELNRAYKDNIVNILQAGERVLFTDLLDPAKRASASLNNTAYAYDKVAMHRRLEQGLSTANVSTRDVAQSVAEELRKVQEQIADLGE